MIFIFWSYICQPFLMFFHVKLCEVSFNVIIWGFTGIDSELVSIFL